MDTGCGCDLVSERHMAKMKKYVDLAYVFPITCQVANGPAPTYQVARLKIKELGENIHQCVIKNAPAP